MLCCELFSAVFVSRAKPLAQAKATLHVFAPRVNDHVVTFYPLKRTTLWRKNPKRCVHLLSTSWRLARPISPHTLPIASTKRPAQLPATKACRGPRVSPDERRSSLFARRQDIPHAVKPNRKGHFQQVWPTSNHESTQQQQLGHRLHHKTTRQ